MRQEWRTDYSSLLDPWADRPTLAEAIADETDQHPIRYKAGEVIHHDPDTLTADLEAAQRNARRNAYPVTRCDNNWCRASVDLGDDPQALCDHCGYVTCSGCGTCDCGGDAA